MERIVKVSTWLGVAASAVTVLAFLGIENHEQLRQALNGDAEDHPPASLEDSDPDASGGGWDDSSGGGQWTPTPEPMPDPTPDPTLEAYRTVNAGDCLRNWMTGESTWSTEVPEVIGCGAEGAALWVSQVSDTTGSCPVDAGRHYLSYTSGGGETVAVCVTRTFGVGQCFLGMPDGSANLMSWVECQSSAVPAPYSQIFNVTGVYTAPANHTPGECTRTAYDQTRYVSWLVNNNTVLVCAVVYAG